MGKVTTCLRWLAVLLVIASFAGSAYAQRKVTLTLNTATIPDTVRTDSFIEVRGAANGAAPATLADGNVIDWSDASTLEPVNIGGDYWQVEFEIAEETDLTFKFYSQQAQDGLGEGWESDPNPNIPPGTGDTTLVVHFFEYQREYRGATGDRGPYDWRPYAQKEDTVAVWFRVAMFGEEARVDGYDPSASSPDQIIGVRGDDFGQAGPIDWGVSKVQLQREATGSGTAGYRIYSGVGYYPASLIGSSQPYKYVIERGSNVGWEEGNLSSDRRFTVPAQDTTLQWVYYGNTAPSPEIPVESALIFTVDLTPLEMIGVFDRARGDTLEVRGEFNGWSCDNPDNCLLLAVPGDPQYEQVIPMTLIPGKELNYKFLLNLNNDPFKQQFGVSVIPSGWEEPISTQGANRKVIFEGRQGEFQDVGTQYFNDIQPGNIIPAGNEIDLSFRVDMNPATDTNLPQPFSPASDRVTVEFSDPFWSITQGFPLNPRDDAPDEGDAVVLADMLNILELTDPDGDMVFEGTLRIKGPTYGGIQYKYAYVNPEGDGQVEPGAGTADAGRRRTRFIAANADGSWPTTWDFPRESFRPQSGSLPFESNPVVTGVEEIGNELPGRISLDQNYPNPFNPTTSFEYSVNATQHVKVRVYDVMGRLVTTLVDGVQPAGSYRVTFDAGHLASGMYVYQLETPARTLTKKMILVK